MNNEIEELVKVAKAALQYIDAIPKEVADAFPAMPGFDRDWAEEVISSARMSYQQLAAENVAIREQSEEVYAAGYNHGHLNTVDGIAYAGCVKDDFYSLALQVMAEVETPATDRIVAEAEARGVERAIAHLEKKFSNIGVQIMNLQWLADSLREGADK